MPYRQKVQKIFEVPTYVCHLKDIITFLICRFEYAEVILRSPMDPPLPHLPHCLMFLTLVYSTKFHVTQAILIVISVTSDSFSRDKCFGLFYLQQLNAVVGRQGKASDIFSSVHNHSSVSLFKRTYLIDIFVNCNWVNTRWQWYSTHDQYIGQHK